MNKDKEKIDWVRSTPFLFMQIGAFVGLFFFPVTWKAVALVAVTYSVRMWLLTTTYHRYFAHRSFKTSRWFQFVLAFFTSMTIEKGVLWWASNHRHHHRYSDKPEDVHSPVQRGFLYSHIVWLLTPKFEETKYDQIRDFTKYPEIMWLNDYWIVPVSLYGGALYLFGGWAAFFWGFFFSTMVLFHGTSVVNSLAHVWGTRRYETDDASRNNFFIALITMGEGWHNNHHHYMNSARQGFFWWEIDVSYYILKLFEKVGLVWDIREPPEHVRRQPPLSQSA